MCEGGRLWRSVLFVPGSREDMIVKTVRRAPDAVVVDLEDAVAAAEKQAARQTAIAAVDALAVPEGTLVLVRVNPTRTPWSADDLVAVAGSAAAGVVLPKLESRRQLAAAREQLAAGGRDDAVLAAGLESARGVADARELLTGELDAVYFGAEDYIADLGGRRTATGLEVLYARSQVCLAARLAGVPAVDQAVVEVHDEERFRVDARDAAALGFVGKICLHPRQVELSHEAFTPTTEEVAQAREMLTAAREGVATVHGQMVDEVHARMARTTLQRAGVPS